ncbi:hypothetical protein K2173_002815 [Erythroxylum novogranatense]|uniref:Uncharacterized protein n=1 Tax=Erythroxylum novogranatense TaxID=1862640 RepID=A0AAV8SR28_9ROSI|nr:hypothetical protein K2173_002815 [Erythroxylum novogranatense]
MKLSLILQDDDDNNHNYNPLLKAKLPISIFNQPFTSIFTTTTTTNTNASNSFPRSTFSLSTNCPLGLSLKLTYAQSTAITDTSPFSLSLRSGLGFFGSPHNSPLVFSASFSLSTASPNTIVPSFSLQFKPQHGHFSLHRKTESCSYHNPDVGIGSYSTAETHLGSGSLTRPELGSGFSPDGSLGWQELKLEPFNGKEKEGFQNLKFNDADGVCSDSNENGSFVEQKMALSGRKKDGIFGGVSVRARTVLPLTKRVLVNLRWGVNLPNEMGTKLPYLTVNKIGIERVEGVKELKEKGYETNLGDVQLLKGMCFWIRRDLEALEKENKDLKQILEDMRHGVSNRDLRRGTSGVEKRFVPELSSSFGNFEQRLVRKNDGEQSRKREVKKPVNGTTDLKSELEQAIKAASS